MPSQLLDEIVDFAGFQAAIRLCRSYGGRLLYVPAEMAETHPVALCMGFDAARELSRRYGSSRLSLPAETTALREQRNRLIAAQYRGELGEPPRSVSWLSRQHQISRKSVVNILDALGVPRRFHEEAEPEEMTGG